MICICNLPQVCLLSNSTLCIITKASSTVFSFCPTTEARLPEFSSQPPINYGVFHFALREQLTFLILPHKVWFLLLSVVSSFAGTFCQSAEYSKEAPADFWHLCAVLSLLLIPSCLCCAVCVVLAVSHLSSLPGFLS